MTTPATDPTPTLATALVQALAELENPVKDATADAGTYRYAYATLAAVLDRSRPVLGRHRLALLTPVESHGPAVVIRAVFIHGPTGETLEAGRLELARGSSAQQLGSALSYGRRYVTLAALGLAPDDDDGQSAAPLEHLDQRPAAADPDTSAARLVFDRLKSLAGTPAADLVKEAARDAGRKLTLTDLVGYPGWRAEVLELLDAIDTMPTPDLQLRSDYAVEDPEAGEPAE